MAEIETKIEEKTAPVVASAGKVQRVNTIAQQEEKVEEIAEEKVEEEKEVEFTEEQKKAFFKKMGIEYKGDDDFEALKEKLKTTEAQPSEEDKKKAISA